MAAHNSQGSYNSRNLLGQRFGRLVVIEDGGIDKWHLRRWICQCDCGTIKSIPARYLIKGKTLSCSCLQKDFVSKLKFSHGLSHTPEYHAWHAMISRCENPLDDSYDDYGGRGIKVIQEWHDFETFYHAAGKRPNNGYSIDRIDVNGNYEPGNIRWATREQQQRNKRNTVLISYQGEEKTMAEWAEVYHVPYRRLWQRLKKWNWPIERALTEIVHRLSTNSD